MIIVKTFCGRELYFSDCDSDIVSGCRFSYDQLQQTYSIYNRTTKKRKSVNSAIFGCDLKTAIIHLDGNSQNFQRENIKKINRSDFYRYRPPTCGRKYKGVCKAKKIKCGLEKYIAQLTLCTTKSIRFTCDTEQQAASLYNAMCDFLDFPGYRNGVPKIELTVEQKKHIYKKLKQYKTKGLK